MIKKTQHKGRKNRRVNEDSTKRKMRCAVEPSRNARFWRFVSERRFSERRTNGLFTRKNAAKSTLFAGVKSVAAIDGGILCENG